MRHFHIFIEDRTQARPLEVIAEVRNETRAQELARALMDRTSSYVGVEVCEHGTRVFGLGTLADRSLLEPRPGSPSRAPLD